MPFVVRFDHRHLSQFGLAGFLEGHNGGALETQVGLEILGDLSPMR